MFVHCFEYRKTCRRLVDGRRVLFDYLKSRRKLVKLWIVRVDFRKACRRLVDDLTVRFDFHKICTKFCRRSESPRSKLLLNHLHGSQVVKMDSLIYRSTTRFAEVTAATTKL